MNVIVTAYNPNWPALYEQEAQAIRQILGKELIAIHHIGSTSVPGLFAKPIIDIMPVVAHIEAVDLLRPRKCLRMLPGSFFVSLLNSACVCGTIFKHSEK